MILFAAMLLGATPVASFDCAKAGTDAERTICADPVLARADAAMAAAYERSMAALSRVGRVALRAEQRTFLAFDERECRPGGLVFLNSGDGKPQSFAHCLLLAFWGRTRELTDAVRLAGGLRFFTSHRSRMVHTAPSDDGNLPPVYAEAVTLVQIDAARTPAEQAWNERVRRSVREWLRDGGPDAFSASNGPGDTGVEVTVASASSELVSAIIGIGGYSGGAHPHYSSATLNWSLRLGRPITAADLFVDPGAPALRRLVTAHYGAGGYTTHDGCDAPVVAKSKFTVSRTGVTFTFDSYELGGYPCSGGSELSWRDLRPFLKRLLPFDPARLEALRPVAGAPSPR